MKTTNQNRQKGVALMLALILLLLITAIAFGVIGMSNTENAINTNFKSAETEYFAARAGVEEARNRLLPGALDQNGASIALTAPTLPTAPPDAGGKVLYLLNMPLTAANEALITTPGNPYFDDALCHDIPATSGLAITHTPNSVRCVNTLPAASFTFAASAGPFSAASCASPCVPLDYKWVRIMIKENYSGPYKADNAQGDTLGVCWDKSLSPPAELVTASVANCAQGGTLPLARPVYLITALATNASGTTRRMVQEETSLGITYNPNYAIYGVSTACPAINFTGNGKTGSFTAVAGSEPASGQPPNGANYTSGADVGTNGGIALGGNSTIGGIAGVATNPPCFIPDKMFQPATSTPISKETFPVYPAPNPPPPTTKTNITKNTTMVPGNNYGNISLSGSAVVTLSIPDGQGTQSNPAVYVMNSLSMTGQSSMVIKPADGAACGGNSYCYVNVIIAGNNVTTALDLEGGSWGNTSGLPETLIFNLAQPTSCTASPCGNVALAGNGGSFAVVNAPMDHVTINGNGDIFGSVVSYSTTDTGNGTLWHDSNAANQYNADPYLHLIAFRELNY
jgi:hypothetical protein